MTALLRPARREASSFVAVIESWLVEDKRALHGVALSRILAGSSVLGLLVTNFGVRSIVFGPGAVWAEPARDLSQYAPIKLVENAGGLTFTLFYLAVMIIALLYVFGWHTRLVGPLMVIGNVAIIEQNPVLGDQGDNIIRIGLITLLFMHTNEYWSLDARRRARTERRPILRRDPAGAIKSVIANLWCSQFVLPRWFSNSIHNIALGVLAFQIFVIYIAAGMFKIQGTLWQNGTALYYPLQLQEFKPLPFLSDAFTHFGVIVAISTYLAVFIQLFFPPLLLHPVSRRIALALIILLHLSIAILMALPWFSLSMIAFDAIFVSTSTYVAFDLWIRPRLRAIADRFGKTASWQRQSVGPTPSRRSPARSVRPQPR